VTTVNPLSMGSSACSVRLLYTSERLLQLYNSTVRVSSAVDSVVRELGIRSVCRLRSLCRGSRISSCSQYGRAGPVFVCQYRGRRAGRVRQCTRVGRHVTRPTSELVFGCPNIWSLGNKLDDLLDVQCDQLIDVLFLCETWHDADSVALRRLRLMATKSSIARGRINALTLLRLTTVALRLLRHLVQGCLAWNSVLILQRSSFCAFASSPAHRPASSRLYIDLAQLLCLRHFFYGIYRRSRSSRIVRRPCVRCQ